MVNGIVQAGLMNSGKVTGPHLVPVVPGIMVIGCKEKVVGIGKKVIGDNNI
jgi:hypothetical protein